jgi:RNA-directed DNA polymerase
MLTQGQTRWSILPPSTMPDSSLLRALAQSLLAGEPTVELLTYRCSRTLGKSWRWLGSLAQRYINVFADKPRPRHRDVVQFLRNDSGFKRAQAKYLDELSIAEWLTEPQQMQPIAAAETWNVPTIESAAALASWLGLHPDELRWFADLKALGYKERPQLRHYHYRVLAKRFGSIRLIEAPKARLKDLQQQILVWILAKIPPHPAIHGFVKGRSIKTFVAPHVARRVVLRMDLRDFFPTFSRARIQTAFRTFGYPESVADLLGGICTNATPRKVWGEIAIAIDPVILSEARQLYSRPHLPQGAPTSPALANICCYRLDCRLAALAKSAGAAYTRYADDLAFSGDEEFEKGIDRFGRHVAAVLLEEGFTVHHRKTRVMRQGVRQHLAGLVTNHRPNVPRSDFDHLKATLTNCVRFGPGSQNREGRSRFRLHLEGRVSFVEMVNPGKGKRLRTIFDQIHWPE